MAQKYIVRAIRTDNGIELLADETAGFAKQKEILYSNANNAKYLEVQMFSLEPHTRVFRPAPAAESAKTKKKV